MNTCTIFMIGCTAFAGAPDLTPEASGSVDISSNYNIAIGCDAWPKDRQGECKARAMLPEIALYIGDTARNLIHDVMPEASTQKCGQLPSGELRNSVIIGELSGLNIAYGECIIIIGRHSGNTLVSGHNVTLIGNDTDVPEPSVSNYINIQNTFCARIVKERYVEEKCP